MPFQKKTKLEINVDATQDAKEQAVENTLNTFGDTFFNAIENQLFAGNVNDASTDTLIAEAAYQLSRLASSVGMHLSYNTTRVRPQQAESDALDFASKTAALVMLVAQKYNEV